MTDQLSFTAHCAELAPAVTAAFEAVQTKAKIPILGNMLLQVEDGQLQVRATDLDIEVHTSCDLLRASGAGAVTLSGLALKDLVKNLPETAEVTFNVSANHVKVTSARSRFQFNTLPPQDFPSIADKLRAEPFEVDVPSFASAIAATEYAISSEETRPYLCGLNLQAVAGEMKLALAGCDGHNLSVVRIPVAEPVDLGSVILPTRSVRAAKRLLSDVKGVGHIAVSDTMAMISAGGVRIYSKLVEGTYPDYMRIVPRDQQNLARVSVDLLRKSVSRICMVTEDTKKDTVALSFSSGSITVSMESSSGETALEEVDADYTGSEIRIGFAGNYLQRVLASIPTDDCRIEILDHASAAVFRPDITADQLRVLMPKRL